MLEKMMPGLSLALIRLVGLGETLAGLGLVLPAVARSWMAVAGWAGAILAAEAAMCGLPPLAPGLHARRSLVGLGSLSRFCGLGEVQMTAFQTLSNS